MRKSARIGSRMWLFGAVLAIALTGCSQKKPALVEEGPGKGGTGGGADRVEKAAVGIAKDVADLVEKSPDLFPEVEIDRLKAAVDRVRIIVRPKTAINGVEVDAINNGHDLIELNRAWWNRMVDRELKMAIVFRELLGLIGLQEHAVAISSRILPIEKRFAQRAIYDCEITFAPGKTRGCRVHLQYDKARDAFIVGDLGCHSFPRDPTTLYYYAGNHYSSHDRCAKPGAASPRPSCTQTPGTNREWDTLVFTGGLEFEFVGVDDQDLKCFPPDLT